MTNKAYKFYVGIDVSKIKLDIAVSNSPSQLQTTNDEDGWKNIIKLIPNKKNSLIIVEATGGYERNLANYLRSKKFNVAIVNPKRVRDFAKACGKLAKTDKIDATMIMRFGQAVNPEPQGLKTQVQDICCWYITRRAQVIKLITLEKQHLEHATNVQKERILKHLKFLKAELNEIEKLLLDKFQEDHDLKDKAQRLQEIKGVGVVTSINIITLIPELGQLTSKEVASLVGVAPFNKDSGQKVGKRSTWGGRAAVRGALYMAALSAKKYNPVLKPFYDNLIARGKLKKVAIVACMRKLIVIINAMVRDNSCWQPRLRLDFKQTV